MYETPDDLTALQHLLDDSYARAGAHLRTIFGPERRLAASELVGLLTGMQLLNVATVTSRCEPRVAPVDGLFFRGRFWFGSSPRSVRFAHLRRRPQVSASHIRGEELAVLVHGRATIAASVAELAAGSDEWRAFARYCQEVYGSGWLDWGQDATYARIEPELMFASRLPGAAT